MIGADAKKSFAPFPRMASLMLWKRLRTRNTLLSNALLSSAARPAMVALFFCRQGSESLVNRLCRASCKDAGEAGAVGSFETVPRVKWHRTLMTGNDFEFDPAPIECLRASDHFAKER